MARPAYFGREPGGGSGATNRLESYMGMMGKQTSKRRHPLGRAAHHPRATPACARPTIAAALAVAATMSVSGATSTAAQTIMFRGGPAHRGEYDTRGVDQLGGVAWRVATHGSVRSTPAVTDAVVYIGSDDGRLYALDRRTGATRWSFDAREAVSSSPAVAGGLVIFTTRGGTARALGAADGRPRWTVRAGAAKAWPWGHENWDYFASSPVVQGDLVAFGALDGVLRGVDLRTGRERWRVEIGQRILSTPAIADGRVYVGGADGVLWAVDASTGRVIWKHATEGAALESGKFGYDRRTIVSSPAADGNTVYVGSRDGRLYAIDARTGERRWTRGDTPAWVITSPAVRGDTVYTGSSDGFFVHAVDGHTGQELWLRKMGAGVRFFASPVLVGGTLYAADQNGVVHALDAATGAERWSFHTRAAIQSSPVVSEGELFVGSDDGSVWALRAGARSPHLAVYWDSAAESRTLAQRSALAREYLAARGYEVLNDSALARFLAERVQDGAPSAVVFAQDDAPGALGAAPDDSTSPMRRYLAAGGKVVWLGMPPFMVERDSAGRPRALTPKRASQFAGLSLEEARYDQYGSVPTAAGRRWGLRGVHVGTLSLDPSEVSEVLATDSRGRATAWVKRWGSGGPASGFVQLFGEGTSPDLLEELQAAAEYGILRAATGS